MVFLRRTKAHSKPLLLRSFPQKKNLKFLSSLSSTPDGTQPLASTKVERDCNLDFLRVILPVKERALFFQPDNFVLTFSSREPKYFNGNLFTIQEQTEVFKWSSPFLHIKDSHYLPFHSAIHFVNKVHAHLICCSSHFHHSYHRIH